MAGIMGLLSDLDKKGEDIYDLYKGEGGRGAGHRRPQEPLDADKACLQSDEGVRGYFFVTFLALRVYFVILKRLREKELTQRVSVSEVLFELPKIQRIVEPGGRKYFAAMPKRAREMASIFPEALPMG